MTGRFDNQFFRDAQTSVLQQRGAVDLRRLQGAGMQNADGQAATEEVATPASLVAGRDLDRERREVVVPDFAGHPVPEVARFLWLMAREAGTVPPWRVRVHAVLCAKYDRGRRHGGLWAIAQALAPHAQVIMSPDGTRPLPPLDGTKAIEFNWHDQPGGSTGGGGGKQLVLPSGVERSARTT